MQFVGVIILLAGIYLIDSGIRNRAPIGFIKEIIKDPSDLSGTLKKMNGTWGEPFGPSTVQGAEYVPIDESKPQGKEATDITGYKNGQLPSSLLTTLPWTVGHRVYKAAAPSFIDLNKAYKAKFGSNITVTSSYRSLAQQVAVKAAKGFLAATPGQSNHGWGKALDLGGGINSFGTAQHKWMMENAPKYGWVQPPWAVKGGSKPEPWHWEWVGGTGTNVQSDRESSTKSRGGTF